MMKELIDKLHAGDCSLVLLHDGKISTYENRGVRDLWALLNEKPELLYESKVADKTVGKAAAALMATGGVCEIYTDVMSRQAMAILDNAHVKYSYMKLVDHIMNNERNGWCPLEKLCTVAETSDEVIPIVRKFMEQNKKE
jgi:hypothetical protein